jgi:integrase
VTDRRLRRQRRRYKLILETMAYGGVRPGEALGLPWSKVDFERGGIHIVQDIEFDGTIGLPKSASAFRFIAMPDRYMSQLRHWRKLCPQSELDLVFPNWSGNAEFVSNLNHRGWRPVLFEAGIVTEDGKPKYPPKSLRHARASLEIEGGANPKEIQELMGHSSIKITYDVYGHLFDAHAERRATRANAIAHMLTQPDPEGRVTDL